jgi:uncharacterized Tic20 family protein
MSLFSEFFTNALTDIVGGYISWRLKKKKTKLADEITDGKYYFRNYAIMLALVAILVIIIFLVTIMLF